MTTDETPLKKKLIIEEQFRTGLDQTPPPQEQLSLSKAEESELDNYVHVPRPIHNPWAGVAYTLAIIAPMVAIYQGLRFHFLILNSNLPWSLQSLLHGVSMHHFLQVFIHSVLPFMVASWIGLLVSMPLVRARINPVIAVPLWIVLTVAITVGLGFLSF